MMKALVLTENGKLPTLLESAHPIPSDEQAVVEVKAASLNHRDLWIAKGQYPNIRYPLILGSDAAGLYEGREVVLQPGIDWGNDESHQGKDYQILGLPRNGTFAQQVLVEKDQIFPKPAHLRLEEAAALPLAGVTAYRVLFSRCKAKAGEKILVTGAGGGVALFCVQFALKVGLEVYVTSGSDEKIKKAIALGAVGGVNYKSGDWATDLKKIAGGFDIVIDGAGGAGFSQLVKLCNPGARIGIYGGTLGAVPDFSPQPIFWKQLSILGSTMGSDHDFSEMLAFVNKHEIVPIIDSVYNLEDGKEAFKRMESGQQFGKIVLGMP